MTKRWFATRRLCVRALALLAVLALAPALAPPAAARQIEPPSAVVEIDEIPTAQVAQRGRVSLQQAIAIATRRYNGRVVKADTTTRNGRTVHEIRILNEEENRVRTVRVDADTGEVR